MRVRRLPATGEQDFARYRAECGDDVGFGNHPRKRFGAGGGVSDDESRVALVHGQRAADDRYACQPAGLFQDVAHARPVHGEHQRIGAVSGVGRSARLRRPASVASEALELSIVVRVTEDYVMAGAREDCAELAAHQPRAETSNSHDRR